MSAIGGLAKLALALLPHLAMGQRIEEKVEAKAADVALVCFAGISTAIAVACGAVALWVYSESIYGPVIAPLFVGGAFAGLAILLVLVRIVIAKQEETRAARRRAEIAERQARESPLGRDRGIDLLLTAIIAGATAARTK